MVPKQQANAICQWCLAYCYTSQCGQSGGEEGQVISSSLYYSCTLFICAVCGFRLGKEGFPSVVFNRTSGFPSPMHHCGYLWRRVLVEQMVQARRNQVKLPLPPNTQACTPICCHRCDRNQKRCVFRCVFILFIHWPIHLFVNL